MHVGYNNKCSLSSRLCPSLHSSMFLIDRSMYRHTYRKPRCLFPPFQNFSNLISDETFCTQSQNYVEEVPEFSAESLCFRQGMVTSGHWCHMIQLEDDSWDVQAGVPVQFRPPLVYSDGLFDSPPGHLVFLVQYLGNYVSRVQKHSLPNIK